jgi:hypothetical protein
MIKKRQETIKGNASLGFLEAPSLEKKNDSPPTAFALSLKTHHILFSHRISQNEKEGERLNKMASTTFHPLLRL